MFLILNLTKYFLSSVRFPGPTYPGNKSYTFLSPSPLSPQIYAHTHTPIHSPPRHFLCMPTRGLLEIWKMMLEKTDEIAQQHQGVAEVMLSQISEEMRQQKRIKEQTFKRVSEGTLVPRLHPLMRRNGLVSQASRLSWVSAHFCSSAT